MTLKNGWVVERAYLVHVDHPVQGRSEDKPGVYTIGKAGAYITESRVGTAFPYIKVHWWVDPGASINYSPRVEIRGPLGLPYQ